MVPLTFFATSVSSFCSWKVDTQLPTFEQVCSWHYVNQVKLKQTMNKNNINRREAAQPTAKYGVHISWSSRYVHCRPMSTCVHRDTRHGKPTNKWKIHAFPRKKSSYTPGCFLGFVTSSMLVCPMVSILYLIKLPSLQFDLLGLCLGSRSRHVEERIFDGMN